MATRTMERQRDRLLTMLVVPLMTCSARLPVYTLIIAALFPAGSCWRCFPVQGLLMVAMYAVRHGHALIAAAVLSRAIKPLQAQRLPFILELPPYRLPRWRDVLHMMWERVALFLTRGRHGDPRLHDRAVGAAQLPARAGARRAGLRARRAARRRARRASQEASWPSRARGRALRSSYAGRLGHADRAGASRRSASTGRSASASSARSPRARCSSSTMGVVYGVGGTPTRPDGAAARHASAPSAAADGSPVYTPLVGLSLMVFFALACQCMSTLAVVQRETGALALAAVPVRLHDRAGLGRRASCVYQGGRLLGFQ